MPDIIAEPPGDDPLVASSRQHTEPRERGRRDELTGLLDRRGFDELLAAALADAREGDVPVGLLLLELDDLGAMNDRLGRESGDAVLGHVARLVDETTRHRDCVCRIGRDELAVVLVRADAGESREVARRIEAALEARPPLHRGEPLPVTVSTGTASTRDTPPQAESLLRDARRELRSPARSHRSPR